MLTFFFFPPPLRTTELVGLLFMFFSCVSLVCEVHRATSRALKHSKGTGLSASGSHCIAHDAPQS